MGIIGRRLGNVPGKERIDPQRTQRDADEERESKKSVRRCSGCSG
jgi:hypothetical protein